MDNFREIRSLSAGDWFWVSKPVITYFASQIGFSSLAVYLFLASMTDKTQSCFPSQKYIADHLNCSRATVIRAIRKLSNYHLISVEKTASNHNRYYLLTVDKSQTGTVSLQNKGNPVAPPDTNNINNKNNTNNIVSVSSVNSIANELVNLLDDQEHLAKFELLACRYPETFLREIAQKVLITPSHKIKKSRYALFMYLIHYYDTPHA